ncbi:MAG: VCBS repeat-containing protein [Planctomycetaceae bacterium]
MNHWLTCCLCVMHCLTLNADEGSWHRHTIDASSRGADGVRIGDVNQDGRTDLVTGWEEGGQVRVCLQPEAANVKAPWPSILVGQVRSPEDAVFADVNGDGWLDVVSCCEGKQQAVFFHINPGKQELLDPAAWQTRILEPSSGRTRWMFCEPLKSGELIFGSKEPAAEIAIWNPNQPTVLTRLRSSGWIMSLRSHDLDNDGDADVIYSDRKGEHRGVGWLENPGRTESAWQDHLIGGRHLEVMFLDVSNVSSQLRIVCNTRAGYLLDFSAPHSMADPWNPTKIAHPKNVGDGKGVAVCDVDGDGQQDVVCTCEHAEGKVGAYWLKRPLTADADSVRPQQWLFNDISGSEQGVKFDRIQMMDIDGDGDMDLVTCEERDNLGVVWYENPATDRP